MAQLETEERVTARVLEQRNILKAGTAYRMAKEGLIPFVAVGAKLGGIRFNPIEVIAALKSLSMTKTNGKAAKAKDAV
jgi:hypothetical protein